MLGLQIKHIRFTFKRCVSQGSARRGLEFSGKCPMSDDAGSAVACGVGTWLSSS